MFGPNGGVFVERQRWDFVERQRWDVGFCGKATVGLIVSASEQTIKILILILIADGVKIKN